MDESKTPHGLLKSVWKSCLKYWRGLENCKLYLGVLVYFLSHNFCSNSICKTCTYVLVNENITMLQCISNITLMELQQLSLPILVSLIFQKLIPFSSCKGNVQRYVYNQAFIDNMVSTRENLLLTGRRTSAQISLRTRIV